MESKYYYAVVDIAGKSDISSKEHKILVQPGEEIDAALELYSKVSRVLNFYNVNDEKVFVKIAFGADAYILNRDAQYQYMDRKLLYSKVWNFINKDVIEAINTQLLILEKPLMLPNFLEEDFSVNGVDELFTKLRALYYFSSDFGNYRKNHNKVWLPIFSLYFEWKETSYVDIFEIWGRCLAVALESYTLDELPYSEEDIKFMLDFARLAQDSDYFGIYKIQNSYEFNADFMLTNRLLKDAIEKFGEPSARIKHLFEWHSYYSLE